MAKLYGKEYTKAELLARVGDISQIARVKVTVHGCGNLLALLPVIKNMNNLADQSKEELIAVIRQQAEMILFLQQQVAALQKEIETLKRGGKGTPLSKTPPPDWVKPNAAPAQTQAAKERKKRPKAFTRPRQTPTEEVVHACSHCSDCGRTLQGGSEYSRRQIIELPPIAVRIIDHILQARHCGVCQKRCVPTPDLSEIAVGHSRFGQQIHALVAYLRQVGRLPVRTIAATLSALCHLKVSAGEVTRMLATVAAKGKTAYAALQKQLRASDYVHGDETGWRENGQNGYLWSFSTPSVCYFTYPKTRAGHVVTDVLGDKYPGIVVSDFYGGYNTHFGLHQRCWVHLWRDVHELKRHFPLPGVLAWAEGLRKLYDRARAFVSEDKKARAQARVWFQAELVRLASPFAGTSLPQSTLCKRLLQFESEMFIFVEHPQVPCENNAAERSVRPRVIARKISGGTRTSTGSQTMVVLSSLFATWQLRGEECLTACRKMLQEAQKPPVAAPA